MKEIYYPIKIEVGNNYATKKGNRKSSDKPNSKKNLIKQSLRKAQTFQCENIAKKR